MLSSSSKHICIPFLLSIIFSINSSDLHTMSSDITLTAANLNE